MAPPQRADTTPMYRLRLADWDSPDDAAAIEGLLDGYARGPFGTGEPIPPEVRTQIVPGLRRIRGAFALLAHMGTVPIGVAVCLQGFSTFAALPLINIHDLVVAPEHQGRGIGTQLLRAVEAHARSLGCCKVTLEVRSENLRAKNLYHRLGYGDPGGIATLMLERPL